MVLLPILRKLLKYYKAFLTTLLNFAPSLKYFLSPDSKNITPLSNYSKKGALKHGYFTPLCLWNIFTGADCAGMQQCVSFSIKAFNLLTSLTSSSNSQYSGCV
jgi:hypothetical protein